MVAGRCGPYAYWSDREGKGSMRRAGPGRQDLDAKTWTPRPERQDLDAKTGRQDLHTMCEKSQAQFLGALARKQRARTIVPALFASIESAVATAPWLAQPQPAAGAWLRRWHWPAPP